MNEVNRDERIEGEAMKETATELGGELQSRAGWLIAVASAVRFSPLSLGRPEGETKPADRDENSCKS
jgi:hypothetical protein